MKRPGEKVTIKECSLDSEYFEELRNLISEYEEKDGLTAVICRKQYSLERIIAALGEDAPQIIAGHDALPKSGAFLIELPLAKGLEFDHVILADADEASYPDDELGKHCLYTAISRATQHLAILSVGNMSVNVKKAD